MMFVMQQHPSHPFLHPHSPSMMGARPFPSPSMRHRHRHHRRQFRNRQHAFGRNADMKGCGMPHPFLVALHTMSADERATEPCQAPTPKETPTTAAAVATTATTSNSNSNSNSSKTSTSTSKIDIPSIKIIDGDSDSDRNFTIALDVPGYHLNNIDITLKPDDHVDALVLEIKGKRDNRAFSATFEKRFRLRDSRLDLEKVDAELLDGLLTITLSKKDLGKDGGRRVIRVRDGSSSSATGGALNLSEAKTSREAQAGQPQEVTANDHDGQKHSDAIKVEVEDVNEEVGDCDVVDVTTTMDGDSTSDGNNIDDSEWEKFEA